MVQVQQSSAHGDKLQKLLENDKLPSGDRAKVENALSHYNEWVRQLDALEGEGDALLKPMVELLNGYKNYIDRDLIFKSEDDFLYRQKGQLKLDNTVLEEFLPRLFDERLVPGFRRLRQIDCGPKQSFAGLSFDSPLMPLHNGGAFIKKKDQDFSVSKPYRMVISEDPQYNNDKFEARFHVSYFATEIKTNLDKTMFQEAAQTANELKRSVSGCKYILLCEWLDMTPISTRLTSIDEVIVLRKAKRLGSGVRGNFAKREGRKQYQATYEKHLEDNPLSIDCFRRFIDHLRDCFPDEDGDSSEEAVSRGYF